MTRKEAAGVIKFEKACVLRQDTPRCNRDCKKCDLLLPTEDVLTAYDMAIKALEQQPCEDTISRQAAIDALSQYPFEKVVNCVSIIEELPSAQPEQLTDKEQRIFLAAMGREEKVCKQVDDECRDCREPYEDSLVRVCHEIIRKVKAALWET